MIHDFVIYLDDLGNEFASPYDLVLYHLAGDENLLLK